MQSKITKLNFLNISFGCLIALTALFVPTSSNASATDNLNGWAWSSNIGWISFNSIDDQDPITAGIQPSAFNYGVNRDVGNNLVGYAWSDNVGWIQFGGLGSFPSGPGTTASNAQVVGSNLVGWARAIAPNVNGASGWDGWISLSGNNYGVTISGTTYSGYAWGGDNVANGGELIGWISFDAAGANGVHSNGSNSLDAQLPLGTSIVGSTIVYNGNPYLVWTISPSLTGPDNCQIAKTLGPSSFTTITGLQSSGNAQTGPLATGAYTFQMTCTSLPTQTVSFSVAVQGPGFTLGSGENIRIQFPTTAQSDSEVKTFSPNVFGGFNSDIILTIPFATALPNGATAQYSFDGGTTYHTAAWYNNSANNGPLNTLAYNGSKQFKVRVSKPIPSAGGPYTIDILGTSGALTSTKTYTLVPSVTNPSFDEF